MSSPMDGNGSDAHRNDRKPVAAAHAPRRCFLPLPARTTRAVSLAHATSEGRPCDAARQVSPGTTPGNGSPCPGPARRTHGTLRVLRVFFFLLSVRVRVRPPGNVKNGMETMYAARVPSSDRLPSQTIIIVFYYLRRGRAVKLKTTHQTWNGRVFRAGLSTDLFRYDGGRPRTTRRTRFTR